jgi:DNA-directed RNA polymerase specialized sigma24 family protein
VELTHAYSNTPNLLSDLEAARQDIASDDNLSAAWSASNDGPAGSGQARPWSLRRRLSPDAIETLIDRYVTGTTARELAEQHGISVRSVKRLVHDHGAARRRGGGQPPP